MYSEFEFHAEGDVDGTRSTEKVDIHQILSVFDKNPNSMIHRSCILNVSPMQVWVPSSIWLIESRVLNHVVDAMKTWINAVQCNIKSINYDVTSIDLQTRNKISGTPRRTSITAARADKDKGVVTAWRARAMIYQFLRHWSARGSSYHDLFKLLCLIRKGTGSM